MSKPIHTYLDLDVVNNNLNSNAIAPQLRFEENRNTPFLEGDSSEYFCSIVRFSFQTGNSLPIFIPRVETGQTDINRTVYRVTLSVAATHKDAVAAVAATATNPALPAKPATTVSYPGATISLASSCQTPLAPLQSGTVADCLTRCTRQFRKSPA